MFLFLRILHYSLANAIITGYYSKVFKQDISQKIVYIDYTIILVL